MHAEEELALLRILHDRVRPEDVIDPFHGGLGKGVRPHRPLDRPELAQRPGAVANAAVHDEHTPADDAGEWHEVEDLLHEVKHLGPIRDAEPLDAFILEAIPAIHPPIFVVAPHEPHPLREQHLERQEQADDLKLVSTTVNKVAIEDKHGCAFSVRGTIRPKEQKEIAELTVQIAKDPAGRGGLNHRWLRGEDLARRVADEHERVHEVLAEELHEEASSLPGPIRCVHGLGRDLLGQVPGLV
mmetsp:Transcript_7106/g.14667  ORF Transcript_7106/g.14667 Transcript_7106/m.14667 type:complete len:242 (-) Transcript_7106:764-1489(-)